jgi:hypothetical protein
MKLLFSVLFLSSCSFLFSGQEAPKTAKDVRYKIIFNEPGWKSIQDERSDYVFQNNDGRILLSNSFCEEFQEEPLESLANKTFKTVDDFNAHSSKVTIFKEREAYEIAGTGRVDGVKVKLRLLNMRRNNCYFDFVGISPEGADSNEEKFEALLKAVEFK